FLLTHRDAFFCSHNLRILIIFVRYKISVSATEGLVQQWLTKTIDKLGCDCFVPRKASLLSVHNSYRFFFNTNF
ncbi:hypothetical protein ACFX5D_12820, partial [Flavobacterium sp. LB3P45]